MVNLHVSFKNLPDQELLRAIKDYKHSAFEVLFDRYWKPMFRAAQARLKDSCGAEDVVQEIFIKIWQRRFELEITGPLENYLSSSVRLGVINVFRSQKIRPELIEDALDRVSLLERSVESLTDYIELEKTLSEAVEMMPQMLQKVYELRSENRSIKEIAGELGIADQTVKNYISEVLRRLRVVITDKYPEKSLTYSFLLLTLLHK